MTTPGPGVPDNPFLPGWADKAGAYLTDKGTLIRIGVAIIGGMMVFVGLLVLLIKPVGGAAVGAVKLVKKVV